MGVKGTPVSSRPGCLPGQCSEQISFACVSVSPFCFGRLRGCFRLVLALGNQQSVLWCVNGGCRCLHIDHDSSNCSHSFSKIYVCPRGKKRNVMGAGSAERISMRTSAGVSPSTSGGGGTVGAFPPDTAKGGCLPEGTLRGNADPHAHADLMSNL